MKRSLLILAVAALCVGCANILERRAVEAENAGDYAAAIELWNRYLDRRPDDLAARVDRGVDKSVTGDYAGAIEDYSHVIGRDPTHVLALVNRGRNLYRMDEYALAVVDFNEAIRLKGGDADGNLPPVHVEWVDNPFFRLAPDPRDVPYAEILFERGLAYCELDSLRRAAADFSYCIERRYLPHESHFIRGEIYERYGMAHEAARDYRAAVVYSPKGGGKYTRAATERLRALTETKKQPAQ